MMKNLKKILFFAGLIAFFASCESDDEKYSGTPVGNQNIETLHATIELADPSMTTFLASQQIPFKIILPRTFTDTVTVEATTLSVSGGRTRVSVDILPGQLESDPNDIPEISAVGGSVYDTTMELYLSGIALKTVEQGKHYLLDSNHIILNTANTSVQGDDSSKLQIKFSWFNPSPTRNNFKLFVDRPNAVSYESTPGATSTSVNITLTTGTTSGLLPGMVVQVSSGKGTFPSNTVVTAVTGPTTFKVSQAVTPANALGSTTVITGGGNDVMITNATGIINSDPTVVTPVNPSGLLSNLVDVSTTAGLYKGMTLFVMDGAGVIKAGTTISDIVSATRIKLSQTPATIPTPQPPNTIPPGFNPFANKLINATLIASFPDIAPVGVTEHAINNSPYQLSAGNSSIPGDYTFKLIPTSVLQSGADIPYRIVWKRPNGDVGFYNGTFTAATIASPSKPVLKVTKTGTGQSATYVVTPL